MHIISVPTIFSCPLPSGGWINLAHVRLLEPDPPTGKLKITWVNGETELAGGEDAQAIIKFWQQAAERCTCNNYRVKNRRKT